MRSACDAATRRSSTACSPSASTWASTRSPSAWASGPGAASVPARAGSACRPATSTRGCSSPWPSPSWPDGCATRPAAARRANGSSFSFHSPPSCCSSPASSRSASCEPLVDPDEGRRAVAVRRRARRLLRHRRVRRVGPTPRRPERRGDRDARRAGRVRDPGRDPRGLPDRPLHARHRQPHADAPRRVARPPRRGVAAGACSSTRRLASQAPGRRSAPSRTPMTRSPPPAAEPTRRPTVSLPPVTIEITPADVDACVETLRDLIRIPSVNPPGGGADVAAGRDPTGGETAAATLLRGAAHRGGHRGRGARAGARARQLLRAAARHRRGSRTAAHPAQRTSTWCRSTPRRGPHDPFGAELIDGVIWGRGAVDMKDMLAMELSALLALHRSGAERRRDVILAARRRRGGGRRVRRAALGPDADPSCSPDAAGRPAAAALNEVGGYPIHLGGRRLPPSRSPRRASSGPGSRATGTPGHGSMPHADNPTVKLARAITRLADAPKPVRLDPGRPVLPRQRWA